ncbi:Krueppel-like factor luna [Drosophila elegans]|uniref:Krueppel-like factor luna n=1 Tax=Drosophila elegans TaxID=30023 RepID=UPI0007E8AB88|nr:Krueppel-like factor luna [Drosophila elegans]XP_041565343.1 Krueppel-like factor luna [Drosophila elegans]
MIGTEDMSAAAGMDISESFRAEDLSKADFFDFVTGPDMGIGIGVGVGVEALGVSLHQQQQHHQNHQQSSHSHNSHSSHSGSSHVVQVVHQPITSQSQQQSLCGGARTNSSMIHDGGGGGAGGGGVVVPVGNRNGSSSGGDPTLQGYEFWHQDKDGSRLDSNSIFEDLDRYCWQQQPVTASASNGGSTSTNQPSPTSPQTHLQQQQQHQQQQHQQHQQQQHQQLQQQHQPNASSSSAVSSGAGSSSDTISSLDTTDGQIYTLTVLNGGEPWLKRSEAEQLPTSLDLDSLLGSFPGYIKSEYPYDDSGFSTDGKDVIGNGTDGLSSISQAQNQGQQAQQTLPSLVTAISLAGGNDLGQQLAQFQNNNNDWHMADHNAETEQSTAESLLRSALQGKGYTKGLHMQNGLTMPVVKDEDMRRLLFADEAAALGFADSTLSAAQMFDEPQGIHLSSQQQQQQQQQQQHNGNANILVDDMFLSLENAFSDDFEKIKRIANEVQQFCSAGSAGTPTPGDYGPAGDVLMQISPSPTVTSAGQLQPPQPLKPEVSTSTSPPAPVVVSAVASSHVRSAGGGGVTKPKKAYKRSSSSNNNNPNLANNNQSSGGNPLIAGSGSGSSSSSGSASSSSNSPPANSGGSSSSSSAGSAQRKERSLHYCSICSKGFKDKYSVNVHIRTHTGEKPFACSLCGKSFRQKAHLAKHYQTHMTQKNNGNLIKGGSGKHPRSSGSSAGTASAASLNQRQLSGGVVPPSLPVMISNPNTPPGGVLPPANGLLTNR